MIKVWDGFIRGFHWLLVSALVILYISADQGYLALHFVVGYIVLALLVTRLIWGVIGSSTAKLSALFYTPKEILQAFMSKEHYAGHNPAGSVMILVFFLLLFVQLGSGLMSSDDILTEGPLVKYIPYSWVEFASELHKDNIDVLIFAILIHISAITIYRFKGIYLVKALVTGYKEQVNSEPKLRSGVIAYILFFLLSALLLLTWGVEPLTELMS